jgi:hypothetical protein
MLRENARWNVNKTKMFSEKLNQTPENVQDREISEKKNQTPVRGQDGKISDIRGKISIGLQLDGASLETRNLSFGCLRFFRLALLPVLDPLCLFFLLQHWSNSLKELQKHRTVSAACN